MINPTMPSTVIPAISMTPLKPESKLKIERLQAGAFCDVVTREILGVSDEPMGFEPFGSSPRFVGIGICLSGAAPMSSYPRLIALSMQARARPTTLAAALLKDDEPRTSALVLARATAT